MKVILAIVASITCSALAQSPDELKVLAAKAAAVAPDARQVEWQKQEFTMFIHFGMNTFTNREWGEGNEDPKLFNPSDLDAEQWAAVADEAGMRGIVLVAKHHDGFCLWPSKFTEHSVKNSPWRDGKGDVVREVAEACKKHGLKFGVYLSPADLHEATYGQSERYNTYFMNQLRELLTGYGDIFEVWFDGATPKDKGQVYNYQEWYALIRELQPKAAIFGRGPDIRWVGNEAGKTRASEWSVIPLPVEAEKFTWPDMTGADLGSLEKLKGAKELHWYPAETDTSIRPGWFWHADQNQKVRELDDLLDCYYGAVGGNSVLLLNVPPDTRGRIHENDAARLKEMGAALKATFEKNLVRKGKASANAEAAGHEAGNAADAKRDTFWTTGDWDPEPTLTVTLPYLAAFDVIEIKEHIQSGQRVEKFAVDVWDQTRWSTGGSGWKQVASGTTIGYRKLLRIPTEISDRVRIRFMESRVRPTVAEVGLYRSPIRLPAPKISRDKQGMVSIVGPENAEVRYRIEERGPDANMIVYEGPFALPRGGTVSAVAVGPAPGFSRGELARAQFGVSKAGWKIAAVSDEQANTGEGAANAIDEDPGTIWHSRYSPDTVKHPHWIVIDMGEVQTMRGFSYVPRPSGPNGRVTHFEVYLSMDGKEWGEPVHQTNAEFALNGRTREVRLALPIGSTGRFLKFVALGEVNGKDWTSAAELGIWE